MSLWFSGWQQLIMTRSALENQSCTSTLAGVYIYSWACDLHAYMNVFMDLLNYIFLHSTSICKCQSMRILPNMNEMNMNNISKLNNWPSLSQDVSLCVLAVHCHDGCLLTVFCLESKPGHQQTPPAWSGELWDFNSVGHPLSDSTVFSFTYSGWKAH